MPLPMPGTPSASRELYWARLKAIFQGADPRVCAAFWLFGTSSLVISDGLLAADPCRLAVQ